MLKKTITYINPFTEKPVTEEHYFHLSKADLIEMEMGEHNTTFTGADGRTLTGMEAMLHRIVESQDGKAIMATFKSIILSAYGKKEGDRFVKSQAIRDDFAASEAFSQLLFEICTDADVAAEFTNSLIPQGLEQEMNQMAEREPNRAERRHPSDPAAKAAPRSPEETSAPYRSGVEQVREPFSETPDRVEDKTVDEVPRNQFERNSATSENPVYLTPADLAAIDSDELKSGLATGRYKIAPQ